MRALRIYEELAKADPDKFNHDLAWKCGNLGDFYYYIHDKPDEALDFYLRALRLFEELAKADPDKFNHDLARECDNLGDFYSDQSKQDDALDFYLRALRIYEELAKTDPDRFNPDLAESYRIFGVLKNYNKWLKKSYQLALKYPQDPRCRRIINTLKKNFE